MTSLTDVYDGRVGRVASRRQQLVGSGLFLAGTAMVVGAIVVATTGIGAAAGLSTYGARELAGILAGLGIPTVVLGAFAVLPASGGTRAAAVIGASVAVLGVALFQHGYPYSWVSASPLFALGTTVVYFFGTATTLWCLFVGLATFETRRRPGGAAKMEVTESGTIRLVEEARSFSGVGSVGLFGRQPEGSVETQTNRPDRETGATSEAKPGANGAPPAGRDDGAERLDTGAERGSDRRQTPSPAPTADGGSAAVGSGTAEEDFLDVASRRGRPDAYCGNCTHFEYVTHQGDIVPYCGYREELMDDMDACDAWQGNS